MQRASRESRLVNVPGLGRKYAERLRDRGITTVEELHAALQEACDPLDTLRAWGIRNKAHAGNILAHMNEHAPSTSGKLTFCVEGNISAGKSTFLQLMGESGLHERLSVVPEPVDKWQRVNGSDANILEAFYKNPPRYAYTFQNYVFLTRLMQERESVAGPRPVRLLERSIFSDRMVFVRAVCEAKWMDDVELALYDSWFDPMISNIPTLVPDGFIYLRTDPTTCMDRLRKRGRPEESTVDLDYLTGLHSKHEDWLGAGVMARDALAVWGDPGAAQRQALRAGVRSQLASGLGRDEVAQLTRLAGGEGRTGGQHIQWRPSATRSGLVLPTVPPEIQDSLYVLHKSGAGCTQEMHQALDHLPALVLDTNDDVFADPRLRLDYEQKVKAYISFMEEFRQVRRELGPLTRSSGSDDGALGAPSSPLRVIEGRAPATPIAVQRAKDIVGGVAADMGKTSVHRSNGVIVDDPPAAVVAPSGAMEALSEAMAGQRAAAAAASAARL